jgi:hypothetical protein
VSILHKNFCNMHIARRNMHIVIESILPLKHTWIGYEISLDLLHAHEKDADHSILTVVYSIV